MLTFPLHYPVTAMFSFISFGQTVRVVDSLATQVLLVGPIVGIYVNPTYAVEVPAGTTVLRLIKKRSWVSRSFVIESIAPLGARPRSSSCRRSSPSRSWSAPGPRRG